MAAPPTPDPGQRPQRTSRRNLGRRRPQQRMARRHRRILGTRPLFPRWTRPARLAARRRPPQSQSAEVYRLDAHPPGAQRHDRPRLQRRLVAAHGHAQSTHAISGSHRRPARHPADGPLLPLSARRASQTPPARLGQVPLAGRSAQRHLALQPHRLARTCSTSLVCFTSRATTGWRSSPTSSSSRKSLPNSSSSTKAEASKTSRSPRTASTTARPSRLAPIWSLVSGSDTDRKATAQMIAELDRYHGLPNGMFSCDEHLAGRRSLARLGTLHCCRIHVFARARAGHHRRCRIRRSPRTPRFQRAPRHSHRRHVGAPVQPGAQPGGMQPAPQAVDHRRPRVEPLRPRTELRLLHRQLSSGLAQVRREPLPALRRAAKRRTRWPSRRSLRPLRSPRERPRHSSPHRRRNRLPVPRLSQALDQPYCAARLPAPRCASQRGPKAQQSPSTASPNRSPNQALSRASNALGNPATASTSTFPMHPRTSRWFNDSVSLERGPLVFSYGIGESWVKLRDRGMTADWQVYPTTPGTMR